MSNIKTEIIKTENISFSYNPEENSALVLDGIDP